VTSASILLAQYYRQRRHSPHSNLSADVMSASIDKGDNSSTATVMSNVTSKDQLTTMDEIIISLHIIVFILAVVGNGLVSGILCQAVSACILAFGEFLLFIS